MANRLQRYCFNHHAEQFEKDDTNGDRDRWVRDGEVEVVEQENATLKTRIADLERQLRIGTEDGARCNRQCEGVMVIGLPENCSCHLGAPCPACESNRPYCSICGESE